MFTYRSWKMTNKPSITDNEPDKLSKLFTMFANKTFSRHQAHGFQYYRLSNANKIQENVFRKISVSFPKMIFQLRST